MLQDRLYFGRPCKCAAWPTEDRLLAAARQSTDGIAIWWCRACQLPICVMLDPKGFIRNEREAVEWIYNMLARIEELEPDGVDRDLTYLQEWIERLREDA